ncbi:MAG: leucine-rich repeat domain-containing protein [Salinivirgaceae bacterium]|jgi:Leucine-rich repeat (LRR) protein|nr:leucine-rich repeat domain-containing protein [Salinivirgaceae bacterium]
MKRFLLVFACLFSAHLFAQEIDILIKEETPYYEGSDINLEIYLINTTDTTLTYFDSRGPSWDESFKEEWELSVDYQHVEILPLNGAFDYKFSDSTIITLQPGDTNLLRAKLINLKTKGDYSFTYTQEQSPKFVKKEHADLSVSDSSLRRIALFTVTKNIKFDVFQEYDTIIHVIDTMIWELWKDYRHTKVYTRDKFFDNIYAALKKPQDAYALLLYCNGMDEEEIKRVGRLKNLKSLTLNNYELDYFPEELTQLNLYELTILPKEEIAIQFDHGFSKNQTIRELRAKFYDGIPDSMLELKHLELLDISDCELGDLPRLDSLKDLKELIANNGGITSIEKAGFEGLNKLKELNLSGNKAIDDISPLMKCTNLEFLTINRTSIPTIPNEIENLSKLKKLTVSNKLTMISDSIGNLSDMRYLSFGGNRSLDSIPSSIIKMKKLLHFDVSSTKIKELPEGISELALQKVLIYNTDCEATKDYKLLKKRLGENFKE